MARSGTERGAAVDGPGAADAACKVILRHIEKLEIGIAGRRRVDRRRVELGEGDDGGLGVLAVERGIHGPEAGGGHSR